MVCFMARRSSDKAFKIATAKPAHEDSMFVSGILTDVPLIRTHYIARQINSKNTDKVRFLGMELHFIHVMDKSKG